MPIPTYNFDDPAAGLPRKAVPVRFACRAIDVIPSTFAYLVTGGVFGLESLITVYEYNEATNYIGTVQADAYHGIIPSGAYDTPGSATKWLPANHFVWSDELVRAYMIYLDTPEEGPPDRPGGYGVIWDPALWNEADAIAECVDIKAIKPPLVAGETQVNHPSPAIAEPVKTESRAEYVAIDRERAAAIASMNKFALLEFIELTGIGVGVHSEYRIDHRGVEWINGDHSALVALPPREQVKALRAARALNLLFPCTQDEFQEWYEATHLGGTTTPFTLAGGFLKNDEQSTRPSVPSSTIIAAFKVRPQVPDNKKWWDDRMRSARKYGLRDARASRGRAKQQSQWHPDIIAAWLVEKDHLDRPSVLRIVKANFPDIDTNCL